MESISLKVENRRMTWRTKTAEIS